DGVAGFEIEFADLGGRNVNVVGAREVVVVGGTEESVAVGQDLQHAFCENVSFLFALRLQDLEDQILLSKAAGTGQIQRSGDLGQLSNIFFFKFCDGHCSPARRFSKGGRSGRRTAVRQEAGLNQAARRCASAKCSGSV